MCGLMNLRLRLASCITGLRDPCWAEMKKKMLEIFNSHLYNAWVYDTAWCIYLMSTYNIGMS